MKKNMLLTGAAGAVGLEALWELVRRPIKRYLLRQSDPYRAWQRHDRKSIQHFFSNARPAPTR